MIRIYKQGTQTPIYEILDYITTNRQQVLDSDIQAKSSIKVEMITTLTSRYGNVRLFSTHDPRDYSSQNWAFASGTWGLQFEGSQMCIKPLGTSANDLSSFEMLNYYFSNVQNKKYKYLLNCSGLLEIYDANGVRQFTADCSAKTDLNKVSQTTIRFFGREMQERSEWMNGNTYDIKIYDGNDLVRHYVPVKRLSDDAIGFYETETETFLTSASSTSFTGTSKSTPDYIYETTGAELFVNRIMCNGTQLNSILCNNQSYWGNGGVVPTATYEILESIITPSSALIDTLYTASENTVVEMTMKMPTNYGNNSHNYRLMTTHDPASADGNGFWGSPGTWGLQFERSSHVLSIAQLGRSYSVYNSTISFSSLSGYKYRYVVTAKGVCTIYDMNDTVVYSFDAGYTSGTVSQTTITFFTTKGVNTPIYDDTLAGNEFYGGKLLENNVLLRDFVPVRRLSDDAIGLYDYVSGGFFENLLGTTFSYVAKSTPEYI